MAMMPDDMIGAIKIKDGLFIGTNDMMITDDESNEADEQEE